MYGFRMPQRQSLAAPGAHFLTASRAFLPHRQRAAQPPSTAATHPHSPTHVLRAVLSAQSPRLRDFTHWGPSLRRCVDRPHRRAARGSFRGGGGGALAPAADCRACCDPPPPGPARPCIPLWAPEPALEALGSVPLTRGAGGEEHHRPLRGLGRRHGAADTEAAPLEGGGGGGCHEGLVSVPVGTPGCTHGFSDRLATSVCQLRHDQMEQGPTEQRTGRSTFVLSSGGAGGRYY